MQKTKIIATLGPSCNSLNVIKSMLKSGLSVFRINTSHIQSEKEVSSIVKIIRNQSKKLGKSTSIMMDLGGPKTRVVLKRGQKKIDIIKGKCYTIGPKNCSITINTNIQITKFKKDAKVKIDDGRIEFKYVKTINKKIKIVATNSGQITANKGVNFPGLKLKLPAVTKEDRKNIVMGINLNVDWFAQSFVRSPSNILPIKRILDQHNKTIPIIAKIETTESIENLDQILKKYDGVLIARGDLGVEMELSNLPKLQKQIINKCLFYKKPSIVATQMLESMINHISPTRAEVNDVANAIYDGVDAIMLSAETAVGRHPVESVEMMSRISENIESDIDASNFNRNMIDPLSAEITNNYLAVCHAACSISKNLDIKIIVVLTETGKTAIQMAQFRPNAIIVAITPHQNTCNLLSIIWGVVPIFKKQPQNINSIYNIVNRTLLKNKLIKSGENFLITSGILKLKNSTNMLQIYQSKWTK